MSGRFGNESLLKRCLDEVSFRLATRVGADVDARFESVRLAARAVSAQLEPRQKLTLEVGSWVVLSALGLGLQFGRWSIWSALIALGGYLVWVVIYSEATVQVTRFSQGGRVLRLAGVTLGHPSPPPANEQ